MTDGIAGSRQDQQEAARGGLADPFAYLGLQGTAGGQVIRVFLPGATSVTAVARKGGATAKLQSFDNGLFGGAWGGGPYLLHIEWPHSVQETEDPFSFGPVLDDDTLSRFANGALHDLADHLGAIPRTIDGIDGVTFAVWAPNAKRVSVVGDFNGWDGRRHPMRLRYPSGVWEIFIPRLRAGDRYKFELLDRNGTLLPPKADPIARATERPPATSSRIAAPATFAWQDDAWMSARSEIPATRQPISIYEVHAASWVRPTGNPHGELDWASLAERLVPYAQRLGFTHVELLPIMEHPFGGSWGYQPLSQFAPSARFGDVAGFAGFVDACHRGGIGVILDWVPAHFPGDPHGLALFDGTALYEHADPREGFHPDWNTYIFNLGRAEVQSFLVSSALYWLRQFHVDGLRVDAVASMLYRDYSRKAGEWTPNIHGGRENLESVAFLKQLNQAVAAECPGALMIAEESTAWPGVSAPVDEGGLGFSFKWNMGWMHDTLTYAGEDPIHRRWHHGEMTFGLVYAFSERFVLPISHDEVVHGKGSLYGRMPGDDWQKRAGLRAYLGFMWTHPGKKLLFMGSEFGQPTEWNHDAELSWDLLQQPGNEGIQHWVADINELYRREPALHESDADPAGFAWVVGDDSQNSVFAFLRRSGDRQVLVVLNFTPVPRHDYRVGVPISGAWALKLNGDDLKYGGSGISPSPMVQADAISVHGFPQSLSLTLPPLAALVFACP